MLNERRPIPVIAALTIASLLACTGHPLFAAGKTAPPTFLLGATWDDSMSPAAKELFYECGCNFVRLQGSGFAWSLALHSKELAELRGHGVYTMLQMGSHWPDGSYASHAEDFLVDDKGDSGTESNYAVGYSGSFWPQYSYASQEFRQRLQGDFSTYLKAIGSDPSIIEVQIHNEPGYHWVPGRIFDYNPKAVAAFQKWLPSQYSNIQSLNTSWGTSYSSFDSVQPIKQRPPVTNIAAWMDWRRFNVDLIAKFLTWEEGYVRPFCPGARFTTNLSGPVDNWYPLRLGDNYSYTAPFDTAGIDIYATPWTTPYWVGYAMDTTRGAAGDRPITVAECDVYDPAKYTTCTAVDLADRLRSDLWRYIGHGAKSILLWTWGSPGVDMLTNGDFNSRTAVVRETTHVAKMLNLGSFSSPNRQVALVVDLDSFLYYGGIGSDLNGGDRCEASLTGLYSALVQGGFQVDIISADQVRKGVAARYGALVLATPAVSDNQFASSLKAFAGRGGVVVAEAPFAEFDRSGKPISAARNPLSSLFGVKIVNGYDDASYTDIPRLGITGKGRTELALAGAKALSSFSDGTPAVTEAAVGHGHALLIASDVGVVDSNSSQQSLTRFLASLLAQEANIKPELMAVSNRYLDTSLLSDNLGNRLIIVACTSDKLSPPVPSNNADLEFRSPPLERQDQLFVIEPTRTVDGRVLCGPREISLPLSSKAVYNIALPSVDSATLLLLAHEHAPLLAMDSPQTATAGSSVAVEITCYNPSNKPIKGIVEIRAAGVLPIVAVKQAIEVPAFGDHKATISVSMGSSPGRCPIEAELDRKGDVTPVESVPIDIMLTSLIKSTGT